MLFNRKAFHNKLAGLGLLGCLLLLGCASNLSQVNSITERFSDAVTLTNDSVYLSVSPQIGRVVAFGRVGHQSVIWLRDEQAVKKAKANGRWPNYGGDKVWPNIQSQWHEIYDRPWPPDDVIDNQPWQIINQTPDSLTLQSNVSEQQHLQIHRMFQLLPGQARVQIHNTITQLAETSYPVHVWSITQVKPPTRTLLHVMNPSPVSNADERYVWVTLPKKPGKPQWLPDVSAVYHDQTVSQSGKLGTMGQWIEAIYPTQIFRQSHAVIAGAYYPERASIEYYVGKGYAELETLSPAQVLTPGQTLEHTVTWELLSSR